jgi:hypothetical protein
MGRNELHDDLGSNLSIGELNAGPCKEKSRFALNGNVLYNFNGWDTLYLGKSENDLEKFASIINFFDDIKMIGLIEINPKGLEIESENPFENIIKSQYGYSNLNTLIPKYFDGQENSAFTILKEKYQRLKGK